MHLLLAAILLLWLQLFWALVPTWRFGEYYGYGWFVPPLAAALAWRRWQALRTTAPLPPDTSCRVPGCLVALVAIALVWLGLLRIVVTADPTWRPPLLLHVAIVFSTTHLLLGYLIGRRVSLHMVPVTVFALSAVPYPWQFERHLIGGLTDLVVAISREVFLLGGRPVELVGQQLAMGTEVVEVAEGCSGIRSLQSLVMVALFFGELLWLGTTKRIGLIAVAAACAVGVNSARAYWLAQIQFDHGKNAAAAAHDAIGHGSFCLSAAILFLSALWLQKPTPTGPLVIRKSQASSPNFRHSNL